MKHIDQEFTKGPTLGKSETNDMFSFHFVANVLQLDGLKPAIRKKSKLGFVLFLFGGGGRMEVTSL